MLEDIGFERTKSGHYVLYADQRDNRARVAVEPTRPGLLRRLFGDVASHHRPAKA